MKWQDLYKDKLISVEEAARLVKSGDVVMFPITSQPKAIGMALAARKDELRNVTVGACWSERYPWHDPGMEEFFHVIEFFGYRDTTRAGIKGRWIDWVPMIPGFGQESRTIDPRGHATNYADVAFFIVGLPNKAGYCSFGQDPWYTPAMARTAKTAVAMVDKNRIWTFGDNIHVSEIDYLVEAPPVEYGMPPAFPVPPKDEAEMADVIGSYIVDLIRDGDTLQVGTGSASEAALPFLDTKNDLGIDTEIIYPQVVELVKAGVITGKRKNVNRGEVICAAIQAFIGHPATADALAFIDQNPTFKVWDISYVDDVPRIASNDNMVSINNLLSIDLLGQGNATHLGPIPLTSPGGQVEYNIGSHYSKGGRAIAALMTTARGGSVSRIVPQHEAGVFVTIPAYYIDYLVTEQGVVNLTNKTRRQRAEAIISVAHPDFQPELRKAARKLFWP